MSGFYPLFYYPLLRCVFLTKVLPRSLHKSRHWRFTAGFACCEMFLHVGFLPFDFVMLLPHKVFLAVVISRDVLSFLFIRICEMLLPLLY